MSVRLFHISVGVQYLLVELPVTHYDSHLFNQSLSYDDFASIKTTVFFIYGFIEICIQIETKVSVCQTLAYFWWGTIVTGRNNADSY